MKVLNVRFGGSTNSSSTHSIVFGNVVHEIPENRIPFEEVVAYVDNYGWDDFRLTTFREKIAYAYRQMYQSISHDDTHAVYFALRALFERYVEFPDYIEWLKIGNGDGSVDHQSINCINEDDYGSQIDFVDMILNPKSVILGGNDNSDRYETPGEQFFGNIVKVRKSGHNTFTIMESWTGNKVRVGDPIDKGFFPELVDMKITDYCNKGCSFCYQNSTKKGEHAEMETILRYVDILRDIGTFEIVLGGGEPTSHPRFFEILGRIMKAKIKPSFTTATDKWLNNEDIVRAVGDTNSRIGVSVTSKDDISVLKAIVDRFSVSNVVVHMPFGSMSVDEMIGLINEISKVSYLGILFLGWKDCGRGKPVQPMEDYANIFPFMKELVDHHVMSHMSVDTSIVDTPVLKKALDDLKIREVLYASPEGKFSMYVDAVSNRIGPSSYAPEKMVEFSEIDDLWYENRTGKFLEKWEEM